MYTRRSIFKFSQHWVKFYLAPEASERGELLQSRGLQIGELLYTFKVAGCYIQGTSQIGELLHSRGVTNRWVATYKGHYKYK